MRTITEIIIHCTATRPNAICTVESIRRYHRSLGWRDIGYHYVIYPTAASTKADPSSSPAHIPKATTPTASASPMSAASMLTVALPTPAPLSSVLLCSSWCKT